MTDIPVEFLPGKSAKLEEDNGVVKLFDEDDDETDSDDTEHVTVGQRSYRLKLSPDAVGTLFCDTVWSGSILLAEFLDTHADVYVKSKRTIEFGAGTALPSLVALANGSALSVITDYPDEQVLQSLNETVGMNWDTCGQPLERVSVIGHEWGTAVNEIEVAVHKLTGTARQYHGGSFEGFDLAILSECLWLHRTHEALVRSLDRLLHRERGVAIVTYAHHIPGMEQADDAFCDLCEACGLFCVQKESHNRPYMWDKNKSIVIHLKVLARKQSTKKWG